MHQGRVGGLVDVALEGQARRMAGAGDPQDAVVIYGGAVRHREPSPPRACQRPRRSAPAGHEFGRLSLAAADGEAPNLYGAAKPLGPRRTAENPEIPGRRYRAACLVRRVGNPAPPTGHPPAGDPRRDAQGQALPLIEWGNAAFGGEGLVLGGHGRRRYGTSVLAVWSSSMASSGCHGTWL